MLDIIFACLGGIVVLYVYLDLDKVSALMVPSMLVIAAIMAVIQLIVAALALYALKTMNSCLLMSYLMWQVTFHCTYYETM